MIYDISSYQEGLDISTLEDLEGVIIRAGWGDDFEQQDDSAAWNFVEQCKANGIPFGFYLFSYATDTGIGFNSHIESEIEHMNRLLALYGAPVLGVWLDIENEETYKRAKCGWEDSEHADELNGYIAKWLDTYPTGGIYCDRSHNSYLDIPADRLWLATLDGTKIEDCVLCQFTSDPLDTSIWGKYRLDTETPQNEPQEASEGVVNEEESDSSNSYTVKEGDTLWNIAQNLLGDGNKYQIIADYNGIGNPSLIHVGDVLSIPDIIDTKEEEAPPADYIVQEGDTLWSIAERAYGDGSKYTELAEKNGLENPELIYPGQRIML